MKLDRARFASAIGGGATALLGLLFILPPPLFAATPLLGIDYSPDITAVLGGLTLDDEKVANDNLAGTVILLGFCAPPADADVIGYERLAGGDQHFSVDTPVTLSGGLGVDPNDVVRCAGGTPSLEFDGSAHSVSDGAQIDAIAVNGSNLLLSFDATVSLPGTITADDEDLVSWNGSAFSVFFDGSAAGVPEGVDLDGASRAANGHLLLSFDTSGAIGTVSFDDEDVLEYTPGGGIWELAYDGSAQQPSGWPTADLDVLDALADSDSDGLADVYETNTGVFVSATDTGSNPLDPDTDGDGFSDGAEVAAGTDPNNPNSNPAVPTLGPIGAGLLILCLFFVGLRVARRG